MKKLRIFVLMLVITFSVFSYTETSNYVWDISDTRIFVDSETNVMYTWFKSGNGAGMSVMLNADGSPKVYDQSTSKYTNTWDISDTRIFVDSETNVMYTWFKSGNGAGMSVMLNADGSPKVYDQSTSKYTNTWDISDTRIFVDSETNVMYTWFKSGNGAGMSIMLNTDGLPKAAKQ